MDKQLLELNPKGVQKLLKYYGTFSIDLDYNIELAKKRLGVAQKFSEIVNQTQLLAHYTAQKDYYRALLNTRKEGSPISPKPIMGSFLRQKLDAYYNMGYIRGWQLAKTNVRDRINMLRKDKEYARTVQTDK
jgi:hypothetical protein